MDNSRKQCIRNKWHYLPNTYKLINCVKGREKVGDSEPPKRALCDYVFFSQTGNVDRKKNKKIHEVKRQKEYFQLWETGIGEEEGFQHLGWDRRRA